MINPFNYDEYFDDDDYPMIEGKLQTNDDVKILKDGIGSWKVYLKDEGDQWIMIGTVDKCVFTDDEGTDWEEVGDLSKENRQKYTHCAGFITDYRQDINDLGHQVSPKFDEDAQDVEDAAGGLILGIEDIQYRKGQAFVNQNPDFDPDTWKLDKDGFWYDSDDPDDFYKASPEIKGDHDDEN